VNDQLTCSDGDREEQVARYVAGALQPEEAAAFEDHFLACARCQAEVRVAAAVRAAAPEFAVRPARRSRPLARAGWTVGLAAAAVVVLLVWRMPGARNELASLGHVLVPPTYLGVEVRAAVREADSLFVAAMAFYDEGSYRAAAERLDRALAAGVDSAPAEFFRGATLLMMNREEDAAAAFRRVLDLGSTPYEPEAHFFLAKALLRRGDGPSALEELRLAAGTAGALGRHAAALADSVEQRLRR
jgi:tetratricopeptide (TPR) repeat protein